MEENANSAAAIAVLAIQLGVIIFAARLCGKAAQKIKIPPVLGELVAGIIIGPYLLGSLNLGIHGFEHGLFPITPGSALPVSPSLYAIATIGSIILLFMSGLETDLRMFFRYSVAGTLVGIGGVLFSFIFGAGLGMVLLDYSFMDPRTLFLGILSTATSVGITARILSEKKCMDSPEGTTILAAAVIDDVIGIICLAVVMGVVGISSSKTGSVDWGHIGFIAFKSFGIWLGATALGLLLAHKISGFLKFFRPSGAYAILALGFALLLAGIFEEAGLAMIVGAYVMGLSLSKTDVAFSIQRSLHGIYNFLVPIFFVVMGMLVDVRCLTDVNVLKLGLLYSILAVAAKLIGCALPARFMNFNNLGALRIGAGMIPRGEVALIIAGIGATTYMTFEGKKIPIIDNELFGVAIIMTLITTLVAPPLLSFMLSIKGKGVKKDMPERNLIHTVFPVPSEMVKDLVLRALIDNFRKEGFRHSDLTTDGEIVHFRRGEDTFTLHITENNFDFESSSTDVVLIKTVVYETFVELQQILSDLKHLTGPKSLSDAVLNASGDGAENETSAAAKKSEAKRIRFDRIVPVDCIVCDLKAKDMEGAIRELVGVLEKAGRLKNADQCIADALGRENLQTTALGSGVALPHARTEGVSELVSAIGVSKAGCSNSDNQEASHLLVLSFCPRQSESPYLQYIAYIASILAKKSNLDEILASDTPEKIRDIFMPKTKN